ncbi:MAG: family 1 glycosylhydrolase [Pyrinomonadaceae bacterium]|nr:family 1 glycosylhydrolase [Phycisphaerales bacterium]
MPFPTNFTWGAASSSYQIEGGWNADGKGQSVWDAFSHAPGNVFMGHTGDEACDHYNRAHADVELMKQINLRAYRFSMSWPRVLPEGTGPVNTAGLGFYDRLVDSLLAAKITPWVTLFHWDLPLALYHRGGWLNREIADWFADYAAIVVDQLSDRVKHWITINEPQIFLGPSENEGLQTSNSRKSHAERILAAHHALLAHGRGVQAIRAHARQPVQVGWAPIGRIKVPVVDDQTGPKGAGPQRGALGTSHPAAASQQNIDAARAATLGVLTKDFWNNTWFADPVVLGRYPEDGLRLYHDDLAAEAGPAKRAVNSAADLTIIRQPIDFYGINVYDAERYHAGANGKPEKVEFPAGHPQTAVRWFIEPEALYWGPKFLYERYKVPIVITENGMSSHDWVDLDGRVRDPHRIDYTRRYLLAIQRSIADGADISGYFHWSIMDNFEWQSGYKERFGLIHVDFQTQERTLKDSAHWYARVIASNGEALDKPISRVLPQG